MSALAIVVLALATPTPARAADQPVGLVISGGVSEGAYQAGVTYSIMRFLKLRRDEGDRYAALPGRPPAERACSLAGPGKPRLDVAAGSSAGNVNAFLAGITWCAPPDAPFGPRDNLFWDSWMNIGWDLLSPDDPDERRYFQRYDRHLSDNDFGHDLAATDPRRPFIPGRPVYRDGDGLVTRTGFRAAELHLARQLDKPIYPGCAVRIGLTATSADKQIVKLGEQEVHAQRFVLPLRLARAHTAGARSPLVVQNLLKSESPTELKELLASAGLRMALPPQGDGTVSIGNVLRMIKASSAFPIAFAPVTLEHCVPFERDEKRPAEPDARCPADMKWRSASFIDGGLFDNQPFGLAQALAESVPAQRPRSTTTHFFVDVSPVRAALTVPRSAKEKNGLSLLLDVMGQRVGQVRSYENLGLARGPNGEQMNVRTSSRFFPLVAPRMVASFGAFMHPAFRVHDYFVGVYDGIYYAAQSLENRSACPEAERANGQDKPPVRASDLAPPSVAAFEQVARIITAGDANLLRFVGNVFAYERYWTGVAGAADKRDYCQLGSPEASGRRSHGEDGRVFKVFESLCRNDQKGRQLARRGAIVELAAHLENDSGFAALAADLPAQDFLGTDLDDWNYQTVDRLLRRAIDIERSDRKRGNQSRQVEEAALGARLVAASALERPQSNWHLPLGIGGLDLSSSVSRVAGPRARVRSLYWLWHLFPTTAAWDPVGSRGVIGWEPKLRLRWCGAFVPLGFMAEWFPFDRSRPPYARGFTAHLGGLGYDPPGRLVDDLQLALTRSRPWHDVGARAMWGTELALHLGGSKLRLAVGLPQLFRVPGDGPLPPGAPTRRLDRFYVSLGLGDVNGTLYGLLHSFQGFVDPAACDEDCDGDRRPGEEVE